MRHGLKLFIAIFAWMVSGCHNTSPVSTFFAPMSPSGLTLTQSVQDALASSDDPDLIRIHVETQGDVAVLSGYVKKIRQSDNAERIVSKVPGVKSVQNNIIVRP